MNLAVLSGDVYAAPYPPQPRPLPVLTLSLAAAVLAINLCAGLVGWRIVSFSDIDPSKGTGANALAVLPPPAQWTKLAVLDAPTYIPAAKYVPVKAEITGYDAAQIIDTLDPGESVYGGDVPCIACDTRLGSDAVEVEASQTAAPAAMAETRPDERQAATLSETDDVPPAYDPQGIPYTWDDTPAN